jgi:hypothetical protein
VVAPDTEVRVDAYTGTEAALGRFAGNVRPWALTEPSYGKKFQRPEEVDPAAWADPRVGWGVVLAEPAGATPEQLAALDDVPPDIARLVEKRGGKVLRYRAGAKYSDWTLRDYAGGGDLFTSASPVGAGPKQLPMYLLIYGGPDLVPWHVQLMLNPVRLVGRLDLDGVGLTRYVDALLDGWSGSTASYGSPVIWAVDHKGGDITTLMRETVAQTVYDAMSKDDELKPVYVDGSQTAATAAALGETLAQHRPAVVVTSSHGMTGPLDDVDATRRNLGLLVDQEHHLLSPDKLLEAWQPDGAVWFAQACCSAGADSPTAYEGLFDPGTILERVLSGVAAAGPVVSPLPRALLGAEKPLRAFIGHVEPTFNWTLAFPANRQVLTDDLRACLYDALCSGQPVGLAMSRYYRPIGSLLQGYVAAQKTYRSTVGAAAKPSLDMLVYSRVTAHDRASTVILGDPTVAVALPARAPVTPETPPGQP